MLVAITREVSPSIERCELTHLDREPINIERAQAQHDEYKKCLAELGCHVQSLSPEVDLPDAMFVEDTAIVIEDLAIITRPGAASRRPEITGIAKVLEKYRPLTYVGKPGTLDGGDVLVLGRNVYIGLSGRTNEEGIKQVREMLTPMGYTVKPVPVMGCLHLKSAVGRVASDTLLINRRWADAAHFNGMNLIDVDPEEPRAAGALLIGDTVVYPAVYKRTREQLHRSNIKTTVVDLSELAKAEAGVTCSSIVFKV